jgi:hypothetical protein
MPTLRSHCLVLVLLLTTLGVAPSFSATPLAWQPGPGYRSAQLTVPAGSTNGFQRLPSSQTHITFTNTLPLPRFTTNQIYLNGSGVCAGDIDGDGWVDLFFAGLGGGSTLYRNLGLWRFENVTETSSLSTALPPQLDATGAAFADLNGNGHLDLIVNSVGGGTHVLFNNGQGRFLPHAVLNPSRGGTSIGLADLDGNDTLDLYLVNYRTETLRDQPRTNFRITKTNDQFSVALVNGRPTSHPSLQGRYTYLPSGSIVENGEPDALYLNAGPQGFQPLSFTNGAFLTTTGQPLPAPLYDWGLSVLVRDLNADGRPDIYVCNDFASEDRFWINLGQGRFQAAPPLTLRNTSKFSMGVDAADLNRDGHDDLYVLDMMSRDHGIRLTRMDASMDTRPPGDLQARPQLARSTLHLSRGDGTFAEIAQYAGLEATEWAWTPLFLDVDLDGLEDLLVTTGHARDDMHVDYGSRIESLRRSSRLSPLEELALRQSTPPIASPGLAFRNLGHFQFEDVPDGWGFGDRITVGQGACLADLDNDGDLDVIVNALNDSAGLYENLATAPRIAVRLQGLPPNTRGVGARLDLQGHPTGVQSQILVAGGRYLSSDDPMRTFATGSSNPSLRLEVHWPNGQRSTVHPVHPNRLYEIHQSHATTPDPAPLPPPNPSLFNDVSSLIGHRHYESPFNDFLHQPLLHRRLSLSGPGVAWLDLNGDDLDDLAIATGQGGRPGLFLYDPQGRFLLVESPTSPLESSAVLAIPNGSSSLAIMAAANEDPTSPANAQLIAYDATGNPTPFLNLNSLSPGPLALADVNADGSLELLVGGAPIPGRYPQATPTRLFHRPDKAWAPYPNLPTELSHPGLVSGAMFADLNLDGFPELALACEWGPVRIFANHHGRLREATVDWGLSSLTGWWSGIHAGDFNNDGLPDLVVGNWGLNSRYRPTHQHPIRLYHGDFSGQDHVDLIEAAFEPTLKNWAPQRDLNTLSRQLPWLREFYPSHAAFAQTTLPNLLAHRQLTPRILEATTLASMLLLNRRDHFEPIPLPPEAQFAPVFGINVADFDLDGHLDLFLAQNFFAVSPAISGQDAGRGLLLLGNGQGQFQPLPGSTSGILAYGEQRGSAVADFNADGRPDLALTQNAADTKLYRNQAPQPGLALRFRGPPGNPHGIGTSVRIIDPKNPATPRHLIHAGSGYRSQDAPALFLPRFPHPVTLEIHPPGGPAFTRPLSAPSESTTLTLDLPQPKP